MKITNEVKENFKSKIAEWSKSGIEWSEAKNRSGENWADGERSARIKCEDDLRECAIALIDSCGEELDFCEVSDFFRACGIPMYLNPYYRAKELANEIEERRKSKSESCIMRKE